MYIRRIIFSLMLLLTTSACYAGDISRDHDFTDGEVLTAAQLDTAFDEIVNEVNDLDGDNLASNIAITTSGNAIFSGSFTLSGAVASSGVFTSTGSAMNFGNGGTDAITINSPGGLTFTPSAVWTFTGAQTVSGTWSNLGIVTTVDVNGGTLDGVIIGGASAAAATVTTLNTGGKLTAGANEIEGSNFDINGGTLDGVTIGGATATGTIFYNDASDDVALLAPGTDGQVVTSTGATGIPAYENPALKLLSSNTFTSATTTADYALTAGKSHKIIITLVEGSGSASGVLLRFNNDSGGNYTYDTAYGSSAAANGLYFVNLDNGQYLNLVLDIPLTKQGDNTAVYVIGQQIDTDGGTFNGNPVYGYYVGASAPASIDLTGNTNALTGSIDIYEYN